MKNSLFFSLVILLSSVSCADKKVTLSAAEQLHHQACSIQPYASDDPWHITNLYNCGNRELFVPYQLWTGAEWNGDKQAPCMHAIDRRSVFLPLADNDASGEVIIRGPLSWQDPKTGEAIRVWERIRPQSNSHQYYACHKRGIGQIHNVNKPKMVYIRDLCRAPGGFGWQVGKRRTCTKTTVEIEKVELDSHHRLNRLSVKYWFRDKLKHHYVYKPNQGATEIFSYKKK
ncbi:MAG: hypothetical protein ACJAUP_001158 [Cellvibrionaceae bacterium]